MFVFAAPRAPRRPSLTPMIDVVFLLLVFFMLASRFGADSVLELALASPRAEGPLWQGPPRLVGVTPEGVRLNGVETAPEALPGALAALMQSPEDPVILRAEGADVQRLVAVLDRLRAAGLHSLVLVE